MSGAAPRWDQRACATQPELWDAPRGIGAITRAEQGRLDLAAAICRQDCPVLDACRALSTKGASGVVAGVLHREPATTGGVGRPRKLCGTQAAYIRHRRAGEQPCQACTEANADYNRQRRAAS